MTIAAVDIGTNSVRLLIVDAEGRELERRMQITRLGQGVDKTGALHPDAIARTTEVLRQYAELMARYKVERTRATATSAARDAANRDLFFDQAQAALGVRPELLAGEEEALLSFRGATRGLEPATGPFLVVDIGGGSTEFILGQTAPEALISVDMGCVRMTERHITHDPPERAELEACAQDVQRTLERVRTVVPVERARLMIGLAGTVTSLAALQLGLQAYDASRTHHSRLTRANVEQLLARLAASDVAARRAMLAEPKRAEVLIGGVCVLAGILREFDIAELLVSETDILDGLAQSLR